LLSLWPAWPARCYQPLAAELISECIRNHGIGETISHIELSFVVTALAVLAFNSMLTVEGCNRKARVAKAAPWDR
jgi:hypothetical protein